MSSPAGYAPLAGIGTLAALGLACLWTAAEVAAADTSIVVREHHLDCVIANVSFYRAQPRDPQIIVLPACGRGTQDLAHGERSSLPTPRMRNDISDFLPVTKADLECLVLKRNEVAKEVEGAEGLVRVDFRRCSGSAR